MHTRTVLQKFFQQSFPSVHRARLRALQVAVDAVVSGASVSVTAMGRQRHGRVRIKHRIKQMDRLVGNRNLYQERPVFYRAMIQWLMAALPEPIILIDWSDFSKDRKQQLLRASIPVGGRSLTLYEELHSERNLGNRDVQHRFLATLNTLLPSRCKPIIVADSGFRVPFFRQVEALGWHWLGRIRGKDFVQWAHQEKSWFPAKSLYAQAQLTPKTLGHVQWVRSNPLSAFLVLVRQPRRGRHAISPAGRRRNSRPSKVKARREKSLGYWWLQCHWETAPLAGSPPYTKHVCRLRSSFVTPRVVLMGWALHGKTVPRSNAPATYY